MRHLADVSRRIRDLEKLLSAVDLDDEAREVVFVSVSDSISKLEALRRALRGEP